MAMNNQQPTKEQEAMAALNNAFANLQAAGTTIGNAMKAIQDSAQSFNLAIQERDAKIKGLEEKLGVKAKEEALVAQEIKNKK